MSVPKSTSSEAVLFDSKRFREFKENHLSLLDFQKYGGWS
jgi:hypothetical protein